MGKFDNDAKKLLDYIGGKNNIKAVSHCMTRLRFVLENKDIADIKKIESLKSVKGSFSQAGQFQVIIGNEVQEFFNTFTDISGIEGVSKDNVKNAAKSNQSILQRLIGALGEIFAPIIPALVCGGLILGFRNIIDSIYMFENGTKTLVQISQFWAGVDSFLWLIGEAVFHFLPVGIVWSITKKMGTTQILGIILGITLVSPQLLNAYSVASTSQADIPVWNFGTFSIQMIGYQAQVIPAMLAGFVLVYLEKLWRKIIPEYLSMVLVPFLSLLPAVIVAHVVVGPIGWTIGNFISTIVYAGLSSNFKWLFAAIFGFVYAPLVITGLHHMTNAIDTQLVSTFGGTILWPMIALSNIAQGSAVLAMCFIQRKDERAEQINIPATISCYLGVTEPALFGVNLKYMFPFISGMIGSAIAAAISVGFGVQAVSIGVGGIPGILSIFFRFWLIFAIAMAVAIVVPFLLTYLIAKKKFNQNNTNKSEESYINPLEGRIIPLDEIDDKVFSKGIMGEGYAVDLSSGKVVAPFSGVITSVFPTGHAYGIKTDFGDEILIHLGMDTVELKGDGFNSLVSQDERVVQGQELANIDVKKIKDSGKSLVSPIVFTNGRKIKLNKKGNVKLFESDVVTFLE